MRFAFFIFFLVSHALRADTTVSTTDKFAWVGNFGWVNWQGNVTNGAEFSEYVLGGYLYVANVGWISMGDGTPANGVQYANSSGTDFGVNFLPSATPGFALLRGMAYGANIGWINFEGSGNARVDLITGKLLGYAWSANCGWINLGDTSFGVRTDTILLGADTDGDDITDNFERSYFGNLMTANAISDYDGDGTSDRAENDAGTNPIDNQSTLRIVTVERAAGPGVNLALTFTTSPTRFYQVEQRDTLTPATEPWVDSGLGVFLPGAGAQTQRTVSGGTGTQRFFRVQAIRPLAP